MYPKYYFFPPISNISLRMKLLNLHIIKNKNLGWTKKRNITESLLSKQHSLIRDGVSAGRSMRRNWWPTITTHEVSDTAPSQRRTWTSWTCWMHHSPLRNNPCWMALCQPSCIALVRLQSFVVRVLWLYKIFQAPHIC